MVDVGDDMLDDGRKESQARNDVMADDASSNASTPSRYLLYLHPQKCDQNAAN